jgi:hypothetical protein
VKTYKEIWKESEKGQWAIAGSCAKCGGRVYSGGYCLDCGVYCSGDKRQVDARYGPIARLFDAPREADL